MDGIQLQDLPIMAITQDYIHSLGIEPPLLVPPFISFIGLTVLDKFSIIYAQI